MAARERDPPVSDDGHVAVFERLNVWLQAGDLKGPLVPLPVHFLSKQNILPHGAGEHEGILRGETNLSLHQNFAWRFLNLSQDRLDKSRYSQ